MQKRIIIQKLTDYSITFWQKPWFSFQKLDRCGNDVIKHLQKPKLGLEKSDSFLPGEAHLPRAWWVLKKRRHDDLTAWLFCSFAQETPLNTGPEQLTATTRRRLAMMHTRPTYTPGGAQRDRQHPSWSESREEGERGHLQDSIEPHLPSLCCKTEAHTYAHALYLHCFMYLNPPRITPVPSNKHLPTFLSFLQESEE